MRPTHTSRIVVTIEIDHPHAARGESDAVGIIEGNIKTALAGSGIVPVRVASMIRYTDKVRR